MSPESKHVISLQCTLCSASYLVKQKRKIWNHAIYCHGIHNPENLILYFDRNFTLANGFSTCALCNSIFYKYMRHNNDIHNINNIYYCVKCNFMSCSSQSFSSHNHVKNKIHMYWCLSCYKIIQLSSNLTCHLNTCFKQAIDLKRDYETNDEDKPLYICGYNDIELGYKPYTFPGCNKRKAPQPLLSIKKAHNVNILYSRYLLCRFCKKQCSNKGKCKVCIVVYCTKCKAYDPYLYTKGLCMHCYMHAYSVWNDPVLLFTQGLFGVISGFTRPKNTTSPRNSRGLAMHGPYIAKAGAIVSEALALAVPLDRLNIPYGLERLVEATQYDSNGMPCFLADFGPYAFFAGSVIVPPLYLARDSMDPLCRLEVTLLAGLDVGYPIAVVTLRAVKDFEVGRNKVREITIRRQCLTEYPWRGAAHLCLDPMIAIPPQHRPTELPIDTPCPNSAFSQYFAGKSPFGEPKESLIAI